jgi:hypothetical protein
VNVDGAYCLVKEGEVYIIYLPTDAGEASLQAELPDPLSIKWFNPRSGGALVEGSIKTVKGSGWQLLGTPPSDPDLDWVLVVH